MKGNEEVIRGRVEKRARKGKKKGEEGEGEEGREGREGGEGEGEEGHFMPVELLRSQYEALEEPCVEEEGDIFFVVDVEGKGVEELCEMVKEYFCL